MQDQIFGLRNKEENNKQQPLMLFRNKEKDEEQVVELEVGAIGSSA